MSQRAAAVAALLGLLLLAGAAAADPDWTALADVERIEVLTTDTDGSPRETVVWLAVLDGQGYIRTGSTTWGDNVERDPDLRLRIEGQEYALRAFFVTDEPLREQVAKTFRAKYGWIDGFLNIVRGRAPRIMRLDPR